MPWFPLILAVAGLWNLPSLWYPYGQDQGLAHVVGRLILDGGAPYRDAVDDKPPGIFYLYALFIALGGDGMHPARMAGLACLWVTMGLIRQVGRKIREPGAGLWGAFCLGLAHPLMGFWNTALQEDFILPLLWGSLLCALRMWQGGGMRWSSLCGALLGFVFWFKYPYALPLAIVGLAAVGRGLTDRGRLAAFLGHAVALGGAFSAVVGAGVLCLWHAGSLAELLHVTVLKNLWERFPYQGRAMVQDVAVVWPWDWMAHVPFFLVLVGSGFAGLLCLRGKGPGGRWLVGAYGLAMLALIYLQMRFFQYHWIPLLSFLCLGTGLLMARAQRWASRCGVLRRSPAPAALGVVLACLLMGGAATTQAGEFERWMLLLRGRLSWDAYFATFPGLGSSRSFVLEDWAAARTADDLAAGSEGTLLVWGSRPLVYYFTGLRPASSFLYVNHLRIPGPRGERFRRRLEEEILARPPTVVLVVLRENLAETFRDLGRLAPRVHEMLDARFTLSVKVGPFLVYERMGGGGEP